MKGPCNWEKLQFRALKFIWRVRGTCTTPHKSPMANSMEPFLTHRNALFWSKWPFFGDNDHIWSFLGPETGSVESAMADFVKCDTLRNNFSEHMYHIGKCVARKYTKTAMFYVPKFVENRPFEEVNVEPTSCPKFNLKAHSFLLLPESYLARNQGPPHRAFADRHTSLHV